MLAKNNLFTYLFICLIIQTSCSKKNKQDNYVDSKFEKYQKEYLIAGDSLQFYAYSLLSEFKGEYMWSWQIDSLICLNSKNDKLFTTVNLSSGVNKDAVSDEIIELLGKKIKNKWYFMHGSALVIPRNMYSKDEMHPLSFHELSQIARKEMFGENALIKKDGEYIVNDAWVEEHFYNNGFYTFGKHKTPGMVTPEEYFKMPRDKEKFDSVHWSLILDKWNHKFDTSEYKKQQQNYP